MVNRLIAVAALLVLMSTPRAARAAQPPVFQDTLNQLAAPQMAQNPSFVGIKSTVAKEGSTPTYLSAGPLLVYAACAGGGTLSQYALGFDTISTGVDVNTRNNLLKTPRILVPDTTSGAFGGGGQPGCWVPPWPVRFEAALMNVPSGSSFPTVWYYRLDTGTNP